MVSPEQHSDVFPLPSSYYLDVYRKSISRLEDAERPGEWFLKFNLDEIGIYPKKITSAVIKTSGNAFDILISQNPKNVYSQGDHNEILDEHKLVYVFDETYNAMLIQTDEDEWVVICSGINYLCKAKQVKFYDMLYRYGISKVFNIRPNNTWNEHDVDGIECISVEQYDQLVWGDISRQIAEENNLSNFDWLRFRLIHQLPDRARPDSVQALIAYKP